MLEPDDKLESWKEIASFIGRDVRTAIRWAQDQGMPVHRIPGGKRSRVYAFRSEIDTWLRGNTTQTEKTANTSSESPAPPKRRLGTLNRVLAAVGTMVLALSIGTGVAYLHRTSRLPIRAVFRENTLHVFDSDGNELWNHEYPERLYPEALQDHQQLTDLVRIADLFGDGGRELLVVVPYHLGPNPEDPYRFEVDCFTSAGRTLWSYIPDERFEFGTHHIDGPWHVSDLLITKQSGRSRIWVSVTQNPWGDSFVSELDVHQGKPTLRFVNTGLIHTLNEAVEPSGRYLLVGGFNNEHDSGSVAIVKESTSFAVSPQTVGTRHYCNSCAQGSPDYYLIFPRSEINKAEGVYEDQVQQLQVRGDVVRAIKNELHDSNGVASYYSIRLNGGIEPVSLRFDSSYDMLHRTLTHEGKLNHALEKCPERLAPPPVRIWTPTSGWTDMMFPAAKASE